LLVCFFLSGFAALLYETAWTREFSFVFGTSELAIAAVLAAYMGGLALGAGIAGRLMPRMRRPVLIYGLLELGIAIFALAVPLGIHGVRELYLRWLGGLAATPETLGLATTFFHLLGAFIVLIPCTALMGATLPLLARYAVQRENEIGPRVGLLYAANTAGAIGGTLCAAFFLLPELGLRQTVYVGISTNVLVFFAAAVLGHSAAATPAPAQRKHSRWHWILPLMTLSGAISFAYEVLWARVFSHILGGSTFAFATMLATFLLGIALGSAVAARLARTRESAATGFVLAQLATAVLAWLAFQSADFLPGFAAFVGATGSNPAPGALVAAAVLLPFTACIGATFPFAVRLLTGHAEEAATSSARVYAWNTMGSIVGSVGAGFVLLPILGLEGTLALCVALNFLLAAATAVLARPRRIAIAAVAGIAGLVALILPAQSPRDLLRHSVLSGRSFQGEIAYLGVGRSGTVALIRHGLDYRIVINGLPESGIERASVPPSRTSEVRWLSMLPVLERPDIKRMLIVGLGGGNTLAGVPSSVEEIDVIELEPEVVEANRRVPDRRGGDPLADPRVRLLLGDARGALMLSDTLYDAIVSQPSHPWTSGASHLYTREFFELARTRLKPGGIFAQWIGLGFVDDVLLQSLLTTLLDVFPHVEAFRPTMSAVLFMGSSETLDIMSSAEVAIAAAPESFAIDGVYQLEDVAAFLLLDEAGSRALAKDTSVNTDDHNLLATRQRIELGVDWDALFGAHEPLKTRLDRLSPSLLSRRLLDTRQAKRLHQLIASFPEKDRQLGLGWLQYEKGNNRAAWRHFEKALELNSDSSEAIESLSGLRGQPVDLDGASPRLSALIQAKQLDMETQLDELIALDGELALWKPGDLLFDRAARLRAAWRLMTGDPQRAQEAVTMISVVVARAHKTSDYLLLAQAAKLAGQPESAWAALGEFVRRHRGRPMRSGATQRARSIISGLPDSEYADAVKPFFPPSLR